MATLALFIALGGASYASFKLPKNSVGPGQLKKSAVTKAKIKRDAVTGAKVKDQTLTGKDILDGTVGSFEIGAGQVTSEDLASAAVGGANIAEGAITSPKIADGTVGSADLDPSTVGDIISTAGTFPNDGASREILVLPGFGKLTMACSGADSVNMFYSLEKGAQQNARLYAHDPFDNEPKGAAAISSDKGGGVGYGGAGHIAAEGDVFVFTDDRVLEIDFTLTGSCVYRVRATLDHNET